MEKLVIFITCLSYVFLPFFACNLEEIKFPSTIASFSFLNDSCIAPCKVIFSNHSENAIRYEWNFGDGSPIDTVKNPTHTYEIPGEYSIELKAFGAGATDVMIKIARIQPEISFFQSFGGLEDDDGQEVLQTEDGGYIVVGNTSSEGAGENDVYLIKTDSFGVLKWKKTYGGGGFDNGYSVQQTSDFGYIITGSTYSYGAGGADVYLIKTNSAGGVVWEKTYGSSTFHERGYSIRQTLDGGFVVVGYRSSGNDDVYLLKISVSGELIWEKTFGGSLYDYGYSIKESTDGGFIIAGSTRSEGAGKEDVYLIKTNGAGILEWKKTYGGLDSDSGHSVQQTTDGGYVIVGYSSSEGAGESDMYLIKTNGAGILEWKKTYGGPDSDSGYSVQQTTDGGYVIVGYSSSEGAGESDVYLIKTNGAGILEWKKTYGGPDSDSGYSVQQTTDGGYIIVGAVYNGGPRMSDVYLIKTNKDGNVE
ncbi:MAG: PKD domain-containing protein [Saprospiraceae bacterium]